MESLLGHSCAQPKGQQLVEDCRAAREHDVVGIGEVAAGPRVVPVPVIEGDSTNPRALPPDGDSSPGSAGLAPAPYRTTAGVP